VNAPRTTPMALTTVVIRLAFAAGAAATILAGCGETTREREARTETVTETVTTTTETVTTTTTTPAPPTRKRVCGPAAYGTLHATGMTCAKAREYVQDVSKMPRGFQCAATRIICWRGGPRSRYETSSVSFGVIESARSTTCPPGEEPAGFTGACAPSDPPERPAPAPCTYGVLTVTLTKVTCDTARDVLWVYLNGGGDDPGYEALHPDHEWIGLPPWVDMGDDVTWGCSGDSVLGGDCYDTGTTGGHGEFSFFP
jgi:hypothetical protein